MAKDHYPDEGHLRAYLLAAGFTAARLDALDLETLADTGRDDFEQRIGYRFLAETAALWTFDPPTNDQATLRFTANGGPAVLYSVTSVVYQPQGGTAETLTANEDYRLEPANAPAQGKPYTRIVFLDRRWYQPLGATDIGSVKITGRRGAGLTIPAMAWTAMLARGAWHAWEALTQATTGGMLAYKEGDVSEDYGVETWNRLAKGWDEKFEQAVGKFRTLAF